MLKKVKEAKDTVAYQRFKSKTPKGWKKVGNIAKIGASVGLIALMFTPAGWATMAAGGVLALSCGIGTWAGYQTNDEELKGLWKKPFAIFKRKN